MKSALVVWGIAAAVSVVFLLWYNGFRAPLSAEEVDAMVARRAEQGATAEDQARWRAFLSDDDGGEFVMVNVIDFQDDPEPVGEMKPGETAAEAQARYMAYMWPALVARACHPVIGGDAAADALDLWGIEGAEHWEQGAMMRYRSRRDLVEIAGNPEFDGAHVYKIAAMDKTIAFPIDPVFQFGGGVRAVVLLSIALVASLVHGRLRR